MAPVSRELLPRPCRGWRFTGTPSEGARITAACVLLDRGYGKAVQAVSHSGDMKIEVGCGSAREKLASLIAGRIAARELDGTSR